jgi:hypothetical protein
MVTVNLLGSKNAANKKADGPPPIIAICFFMTRNSWFIVFVLSGKVGSNISRNAKIVKRKKVTLIQ